MFAAAAVAVLALVGSAALAHPGGMANDGCHRDRAAGERHWHVGDTTEIGGLCIERGGRTVFLEAPEPAVGPATVTVPGDVYAALVAERDELRRSLELERERAAERRTAMARLESERTAAIGRADTAARAARLAHNRAAEAGHAAEEARQDAAAAEARARGAGPAVSPRCVRAVGKALDSGWRFDGEEKEALRRGCLYEPR